jgi:hypothetical protein
VIRGWVHGAVEGKETNWAEKPNLRRVEDIGFTDLMPGTGHGGSGGSRIDWIRSDREPGTARAIAHHDQQQVDRTRRDRRHRQMPHAGR